MLSGRMATPDDIFLLEYKEREFVKYPCDDITLYIEKEYVDAQKKIEFIIPDEGTFEITIRKPEKRKKKKA